MKCTNSEGDSDAKYKMHSYTELNRKRTYFYLFMFLVEGVNVDVPRLIHRLIQAESEYQ